MQAQTWDPTQVISQNTLEILHTFVIDKIYIEHICKINHFVDIQASLRHTDHIFV